jgi:hypothetical protein
MSFLFCFCALLSKMHGTDLSRHADSIAVWNLNRDHGVGSAEKHGCIKVKQQAAFN